MALIAGVRRDTAVGMRMEEGEFAYERSLDGDGTVPLAFAQLEKVPTYYVEESHGSLPNHGAVNRAVVDLLNGGTTAALPDRAPPGGRAAIQAARESSLRAPAYDGRRGGELTLDDLRRAADAFASPDARDVAVSPAPAEGAACAPREAVFDRVVVGRRRQHRVDVRLVHGSITQVDAPAYVLGTFRNVAPTGAALAVDACLGGAIREFTARRMLSGGVGEIFMLPVGRHPLRADIVLFAGLGSFDRFTGETLRVAAENVVRTLVRTHVDGFATVLVGAGSGGDLPRMLESLLTGFLQGLRDADGAHAFRTVTLCELDRAKYDAIRGELYRLASTPLFEDVEITLEEIAPLAGVAVDAAAPRGAAPRAPDPVYLIVRHESSPKGGRPAFRASALGAGAKAAVVSGRKEFDPAKLDALLAGLGAPGFDPRALDRIGDALGELVLEDDVATVLRACSDRHLVVVHDAPASRVPWEALRLGGWAPAAQAGVSRRYLADNLSVAKWVEERREEARLDLLLVVDPTENLPGAALEGERIRELFEKSPLVRIEELSRKDATRGALLDRLSSGKLDVVHYAGHAFFDPEHPARSGLLCHGGEVLSGADLSGVGSLPSLVFFNACEAARVRGGARAKRPARRERDAAVRVERNVGLAEAFLRGGVASYVGTYWPVGDLAAKSFAETFYGEIVRGSAIGDALQQGRAAVRKLRSADWADYVLYGAPDFALKRAANA